MAAGVTGGGAGLHEPVTDGVPGLGGGNRSATVARANISHQQLAYQKFRTWAAMVTHKLGDRDTWLTVPCNLPASANIDP